MMSLEALVCIYDIFRMLIRICISMVTRLLVVVHVTLTAVAAIVIISLDSNLIPIVIFAVILIVIAISVYVIATSTMDIVLHQHCCWFAFAVELLLFITIMNIHIIVNVVTGLRLPHDPATPAVQVLELAHAAFSRGAWTCISSTTRTNTFADSLQLV